jgi:hypothetical protein
VEPACPTLPRGVLKRSARKLRIEQDDVGGSDRNIEQLSVLQLLGARSDPLDDNLTRARERQHVSRLDDCAGPRFDDAVSSADALDE